MIPIYKQEIEDQLDGMILQNHSISIASSIRFVDSEYNLNKEDFLKSIGKFGSNPDQLDLYYIEAVLASTGWNANTDIFDRIETWKSRKTPVDKKFNYMHDEKDIIGHITSSYIVDFDHNVIKDDIPVDEVPQDFDLIVSSVLYRYWSDENLQNRMNEIIAGINSGQWFVSMECLFRNFDYGIITPDGVGKVVARNEKTSFLTKYLLHYGGTGEYQGHKVGRVLRDFTFSGKGLVDNPANKRSLILNFNDKKDIFSFASAEVNTDFRIVDNYKKENVIMSDNTVKAEVVTKAQYDELKAEFDKLKISIDEQKDKKFEELSARIVELETANNKLTDELNASKEVLTAKDEMIVALKETSEKAQSELMTIKTETAKANRLNSLMKRDVTEEKAKNLVEKFANASDEMFNALLESLPEKVESKKMEDEEEDEDKKCEAAAKNLDKVEDSKDADLNVDDKQLDTVLSKASAWFQNSVLKTTAKKE